MRASNAGVAREHEGGYYNETIVMFGLEPSVGPANPALVGRMWDQPCEIFPAVPEGEAGEITAQEIDRIATGLIQRHRQSLSELAGL